LRNEVFFKYLDITCHKATKTQKSDTRHVNKHRSTLQRAKTKGDKIQNVQQENNNLEDDVWPFNS
jgi:uncharacterized C2H2 Zn-finger protein